MFIPTKEIIYGKAVFDYLLLPNRGYLFSNNSTRAVKGTTPEPTSISAPIPINDKNSPDEPSAFSLGSILSDNFSDITDDNINSMNINNNRIYRWDLLSEDDKSNSTLENEYKEKLSMNENRKLPSIEELTKEREKLFKDIK
jgi:hypothetical protein